MEIVLFLFAPVCGHGRVLPGHGNSLLSILLMRKVQNVRPFIERQLVGYEDEMMYHAMGTISELFDGNPPFHGRGAMAFAMNVAEILRTLKLMEKYTYQK